MAAALAFAFAATALGHRACLAPDAAFVCHAADFLDMPAGFTSPHPNFGCVIAAPSGVVSGEGFLYTQGTRPAEVIAIEACRGATSYLNIEPGDYHGDNVTVSALAGTGIERVAVGIRHPLKHLRGNVICALRTLGIQVDVLGEDLKGKEG